MAKRPSFNPLIVNSRPMGHKALNHQAAEQGFTLLELLIAMTISAVLALAGWQVFDGLNRAKERAQYYADQLSELQYAYLQIQQDMSQIVPYQRVTASSAAPTVNGAEGAPESQAPEAQVADAKKPAPTSPPLLQLEPEQLSFVRFADPDPRYQSSPALVQVTYLIEGEQLIRRQFTQIGDAQQPVSLDSVLLTEISDAAWQAYIPEVSGRFPNEDNNGSQKPNASSTQKPVVASLPKGIGLSFTYHDMPLSWRFALVTPAQPSKALQNNEQTSETPEDNTDKSAPDTAPETATP